jgi:predicted nucleotidyltransferase
LRRNSSKMVRKQVACEAAFLLYSSQEKEYKQAKQRAAETLKTRVLPSNFEVAEELDRIAEEREGALRKSLLLRMRGEAQEIMTALRDYSPRLVGSVWRGTVRRNSDIDLLTYSQDVLQVLNELQKQSFKVKGSEWRSVTKEGRKESSFHIHILLPSGDEAEVAVRSLHHLRARGQLERCEIYGDTKTGLNLNELLKVLEENPLQKFVPT